MDRFFVLVGRINSVLFLLVLIGAAGSLVSVMALSSRWNREDKVAVVPDQPGPVKAIDLLLGRSEPVAGHDVQMMRLRTGSGDVDGYASKVGPASITRNILFLIGHEKRPQWLFKDHKGLILEAEQLEVQGDDGAKGEMRSAALLIQSVAKDSNGDGALSNADGISMGLAKPDGSAYRHLLGEVTRVVSWSLDADKRISVVYMKGGALRHAVFGADNFAPVSDKAILNVPTTL